MYSEIYQSYIIIEYISLCINYASPDSYSLNSLYNEIAYVFCHKLRITNNYLLFVYQNLEFMNAYFRECLMTYCLLCESINIKL